MIWEYMWNRYAFMYDEGKGDTLVFGHTPTVASEGYFADGNIFKEDFNGNRFINKEVNKIGICRTGSFRFVQTPMLPHCHQR